MDSLFTKDSFQEFTQTSLSKIRKIPRLGPVVDYSMLRLLIEGVHNNYEKML